MVNYHEWSKIHPDELQSRVYESFIDAAALKVFDIYRAFCYFNTSLELYSTDNLGDYKIPDKEVRLFIKGMFVFNALFYINVCRDYMWQMLYCFCQYDSEEAYDHKKLEEIFEKEDLQNTLNELLKKLLNLATGTAKNAISQIIKVKSRIENNYANEYKITEKCNYIKHRGMYKIIGLDINDKTAFEQLGIKVRIDLFDQGQIECDPKRLMYKEEINVEEIYKQLIDFKKKFIEDFDELIRLVIPNNYIHQNGDFQDIMRNFDIPDNFNI